MKSEVGERNFYQISACGRGLIGDYSSGREQVLVWACFRIAFFFCQHGLAARTATLKADRPALCGQTAVWPSLHSGWIDAMRI